MCDGQSFSSSDVVCFLLCSLSDVLLGCVHYGHGAGRGFLAAVPEEVFIMGFMRGDSFVVGLVPFLCEAQLPGVGLLQMPYAKGL